MVIFQFATWVYQRVPSFKKSGADHGPETGNPHENIWTPTTFYVSIGLFHTSQLVNDHCLNENYHKIWGIWHVYQFLRGFSRCFFGAQDLMIRMSCNFGILVLDVHNLTFRIFLIVFHHFCWYLVDLSWSSSVFHHFSCYFHLFSMYFRMDKPW